MVQPLILLTCLLALSACAVVTAPVKLGVKAGQLLVERGGQAYKVALIEGRAGKALTAGGAVSVPGLTVRVAGLDRDQGKLAKDLAMQACGQAGGQFQPQAIGGYAAGQWNFEGGCA